MLGAIVRSPSALCSAPSSDHNATMRLAPYALALVGVIGSYPITKAILPARAPLPLAAFEDYRRSAGTRHGDTLEVTLDIQEVLWRPYGERGGTLTAFTFAERGQKARVPGPLLRAPAGTVIRVTMRNTLERPVAVYGLQDHPLAQIPDTLLVPASEEKVDDVQGVGTGLLLLLGTHSQCRCKAETHGLVCRGERCRGTIHWRVDRRSRG